VQESDPVEAGERVAVGVSALVHEVGKPMHDAPRLALCGGVALYLLGHVAFRLRIVGTLGYEKLITSAALLVLFAFGGSVPAWSMAGTITVLVALLCVFESSSEWRARWPAALGSARQRE
jgi:amino acid transporter